MSTTFMIFASSLLIIATVIHPCSATIPRKLALVQTPPTVLKYHKGSVLHGNITINLLWYGRFSPIQKTIIIDFLESLNTHLPPPPSAASWWQTTAKYKGGSRSIHVGKQIFDEKCSLGKSLKDSQLVSLASKAKGFNVISLVLTAADVGVAGFCMNRCGTHGTTRVNKGHNFAYAWVGNSATQCPDQCAWPFVQPTFGPKTPPLLAPNGDAGVDGMVINIATVLAGTVTNPFDGGYFQGPATAPLEAVTACTGIFGSGAFPGYPGTTLVDKKTRVSYNAQGVKGRKYLLPAMWDPNTSACKTLV
ncbi:protein EXORDIUM-like 2 [Cynara cardunculus var. scolymus]|uniref:Phosphate-induced protein 1 n=1 Tax=Cynara cardunculus var. scolymus TaxID=59895 RepID=A0A103XX62_CYNCS|nr:protein EXORDIUM-like 2 [Cynara cardunculus var. scolymus]KVH98540.1 Phosphate-induced protein 1 [Cynara cardunculus var. scolymus]